MKVLVIRAPDSRRDTLLADLYEAGTEGVLEENEELQAWFSEEADLSKLTESLEGLSWRIEAAPDRDWLAESLEQWQPFEVGERFYLVPVWRDDTPPPGRLRLTTYPGMACGTGLHPATQLCLIALERWIAPGTSVLDVGTGTGILAEAARLLGAGTVIACDISHEAAVIARANLPRNISVYAGSLRSVRSSSINVVVANLNAATLVANCRGIRACIRPGGRIILSGFRVSESAGVVAAIGRPVLRLEQSDDWACLVF